MQRSIIIMILWTISYYLILIESNNITYNRSSEKIILRSILHFVTSFKLQRMSRDSKIVKISSSRFIILTTSYTC